MISGGCRFHWSSMRTVYVADDPSPDQSLQTASRCWYSIRSEPTKCNTILANKYIFTKPIRGSVDADHEVSGVKELPGAALGAPRRKPCRLAVYGRHVMFVVGSAGSGDCCRHEERHRGRYVKYLLTCGASLVTAYVWFNRCSASGHRSLFGTGSVILLC